jgi:hypothetical protein
MNRINRKQQRKAPLAANNVARETTDGETRTQKTAAGSVKESRSLFHYTTADGIIGILQNQYLFATHADFLNDSTECRAILAVLLPRLEAQLKEIVPKLIARHLIHPSVATDYVNPGSAGPRRFKIPVTLATLEITPKGLRPEIHQL